MARRVMKAGPIRGTVQPDPAIGPMRVRECAWEPAASITIPRDWTSGVYLGKLTAEREGLQSYVVFVVRDDREADFLFQVSDTTWNAYNRWPSQFSLYDDGKKQWYWGPDVRTSFDRPYGKYCQLLDAPLSVGSGEFLLWEFPLCYWMEQQGFDVTYISNVNTHADPAGLRRAKGWLSVGHDEYWSLAMFETMKRMVAEGLNLAFLSGNSICGVIDIHPASDGRANRIIERVGRYGSPAKVEIENGFPEEARFIKNGPSEATLIGARSTYPTVGGADWICRKPGHWLFAGTGMKEGDGIPGLVGWEWHGDPAPIPGLEVVAGGMTSSPARARDLHGDDLPGPEGEPRLQRGDDLVGRWPLGAAGLRPVRRVRPPQGAGSPVAADHPESARTDAWGVAGCGSSSSMTGNSIRPIPSRPCLSPRADLRVTTTGGCPWISMSLWAESPSGRRARWTGTA